MMLYTPSILLIKTYLLWLSTLKSGHRCLSPFLIMHVIGYVHWGRSILCTLKLVLQLLHALIKPPFQCLPSMSTIHRRRVLRNPPSITGEWLPPSLNFMIHKSAGEWSRSFQVPYLAFINVYTYHPPIVSHHTKGKMRIKNSSPSINIIDFENTRVCSIRYVPRHTAGVAGTGHFGDFRRPSIPVSNHSVSLVRYGYRQRRYRYRISHR